MTVKVLLLTGLAAAAIAQTVEPPPIVQLIRAPGYRTGGPLRPYAQIDASVNVLGMTSVTGARDTWQVEMHPAFASIEALDQAFLAKGWFAPEDATASIGVLQPAWSYRPGEATAMLPKSRYMHVAIFHIQPGSDESFGKLMILRRDKMNSVNLDRPDLVYRIVSGDVSSTYIVLAPMVSLKILDDAVAALPTYAEPIAAAEAEVGEKLAAVDVSRETYLFRIDGRLSYVSDDFAAAGNPEFWRPRAQGQ